MDKTNFGIYISLQDKAVADKQSDGASRKKIEKMKYTSTKDKNSTLEAPKRFFGGNVRVQGITKAV